MGEEIKSALEIAMEKVGKLGEVTEQERLRWKYVPEGERLAASYLQGDCELLSELGGYEEGVVGYVKRGAVEILINNIRLPRNEITKKSNRRAMEGLKNLKSDKVSVENVYSKIRHIFNHYLEQGAGQRKQAYERLKSDFEAKMQEAIRQQLGSVVGIKVNVEKQPQFQEEWRKLQAQLDLRYTTLLNEYKHELLAIP